MRLTEKGNIMQTMPRVGDAYRYASSCSVEGGATIEGAAALAARRFGLNNDQECRLLERLANDIRSWGFVKGK